MPVTDYVDIAKVLGEWGPFQRLVMLLLCISVIPNGLTAFAVVFFADTPPHHCVIPPTANISAEWRNYSIPLEEDNGVMLYSKCTRYRLDVIKLLSDNGSVPGVDVNVTEIEQEGCKDGWEYNREIYASTIVSEWDLVCSNAWKVPMTPSVYYFGVLTGSFMSGQLSDRFGRKIILFTTMGVQAFFTVFLIFSTSWLMFSALFFFVGMGYVSNYVTAFVLGAEILSPRIRIIYTTLGVSLFFAFGYMMIPLLAYFIRDWRMLLIAVALPGVFYLPLWRLVPESPRWLLSQGRVEEAEAILRAAAKKNKVTAPEVIVQPLQVENEVKKSKTYSILDLVKSSNIRWITIIVSFLWLIIVIGYYVSSLNTSNLYGDRFLNCFLSAAVEVPAYILSWSLFRSFPRRLCLFALLSLGGAVLLISQLIPRDLGILSTALEMMGKFGLTVAYAILYACVAELYPTVLRNTAVSSCSMAARLGSISAPYVVYLGTYYKSLPYILMGSLSVFGALLGLLLPETHGMPLPETINHMQTIQGCKKRCTSNNSTSIPTPMENVSMMQ